MYAVLYLLDLISNKFVIDQIQSVRAWGTIQWSLLTWSLPPALSIKLHWIALPCVLLLNRLVGEQKAGKEEEERACFLMRKLREKGKAVPLNWKITTVQCQKKSGDIVHCTQYNPLRRLTWEMTRSDKAKFRINCIVLQNMSSGKMH